MTAARVALAAALLLVAACGPRIADHEGVAAAREDAAALARQAGRSGEGGAPAPAEWWKDFGDATLDRLVPEALARSHDLAAAAAAVDAAAAEARIAGADRLPSLDASAGGTRSRQVFVGFPVSAPGFSSPLSSTSTQLGVSLDLRWELDLWGRLRALDAAATSDYRRAAIAYQGARLSLAGQTAKAWFALVEAREQLALAEASLASYRDSASQVTERYQRGVRSPLDVRLALAEVAGAEAALAARRQLAEAIARQLEILLGRYPSGDESGALAAAAALERELPAIPSGLPLDVLSRRPDLAEAEERVFAAERREWAAKASLLPRIALTGSAGTVSDDVAHLLDGDFGVWSWAANLLQPIFEGGRLRAAVRGAAAGSDAARAEYASTALAAFLDVENALAAERHLLVVATSLAEAAEQSQAAERLALDRYRSGLESYVTVLQAQRSALTARSSLLDARRRRFENRVDIYLAVGGGFAGRETS